MAIGSRGRNLGGAYITVEAEVGGFGSKLITKMRKELRDAERVAKEEGRRIGRSLAASILAGFAERMPAVRAGIDEMLKGIDAKVYVDVAMRHVPDEHVQVHVEVDQEDLNQTRDRISNTGRQIQRDVQNIGGPIIGRFASVAAGLSDTVAGSLSKIKTVMGSAKGNAVALTAGLFALYAALLSVQAAFNAIGRESLNLMKFSLALPGILSMVAAIGGSMFLVFNGLDKTLTNIFNKDPKKAAAAMESLHGSTRKFAESLRELKPWYDSLVASTREAFFGNLWAIPKRIVQLFGTDLKNGFTEVTSSTSRGIGAIFGKLATPETSDALKKIFGATSEMISRFSPHVADFMIVFRDMAVAALPAIEQLSYIIGDLIDRFGGWIEEKIASGEFNNYLFDAIYTLQDLLYVGEELLGLLGVLFDDSNEEGESFLRIIGNMLADFKRFYASNDGKLALQGIATAGKLAGAACLTLAYAIGVISAALADVVGMADRAYHAIRRLAGAKDAGDSANWASSVGEAAINAAVGASGGKVGRVKVKKRARGTITSGPEFAMIGEAGTEAVIPLGDPARAQELADQSGLTDMLTDGRVTQVNVYIGDEQLDSRMYQVVDRYQSTAIRDARHGGLSVAPAV